MSILNNNILFFISIRIILPLGSSPKGLMRLVCVVNFGMLSLIPTSKKKKYNLSEEP